MSLCTVIFNNDLEKTILNIEKNKTIHDLIFEYFKRVEKSNLILDNLENTYFQYNSKTFYFKNNEESIQSYFENKNLIEIKVLHLDYNNYYREYKETKLIKNNIYTSIYEAKLLNSTEGKLVAIKKINKERIKEDMMEDLCLTEITEEDFEPEINKFNREIKNMQLCHCENSVEIYDYYNTDKEFIIIMELCDNTLLYELAKTKEGFSEQQIKDILLQLNKVFKKMHKNKISHRDIKLNNILVKYLNSEKTKFKILLSDYGVSHQLNKLTTRYKTYAGTKIIMAPEILNNEKYNDKCDLWSLGIIIYKLKTKKLPYKGNFDKEVLEEIETKGLSVLNNINDEKLKNLLSKLLAKNPHERISWDEYFEHEFFK